MAKTSVYKMVTDRIIAQLNQGIIPWEKPWTGISSGAYNRITKKPYSLVNQMILEHNGEYATFKQWSNLGGKIKKGSKSEFVVFWKIQKKTETNDKGEEVTKSYPILRYYNVFHISQVDGVEPLEKPEWNNVESIKEADRIISEYVKRTGLSFCEEVSNRAFYSPSMDKVVVPMKEQFKHSNEYYATTFHELTHSTGHESRLNRLYRGRDAAFGSEEYSKEELVAEIGSATILNMLGIETERTFRNNVAYIQSWIQVLKNDERFVVSASSKAGKAVDYIMGVESDR